MKKINLSIILIVSLALLVSCSPNQKENGSIGEKNQDNIDNTETEKTNKINEDKYIEKAKEVILEYKELIYKENFEEAYIMLAEKEREAKPYDIFSHQASMQNSYVNDLYDIYSNYRISNNQLIFEKVDFTETGEVKIKFIEKEFNLVPLVGISHDMIFEGIESENSSYDTSNLDSLMDDWVSNNKNEIDKAISNWIKNNELEYNSKNREATIRFNENGEGKISFGWYEEKQNEKLALENYKSTLKIIDEKVKTSSDGSKSISILLKNDGEKRIQEATGTLKYILNNNIVTVEELKFYNIGPYCYSRNTSYTLDKVLDLGWSEDYEFKLTGIKISDKKTNDYSEVLSIEDVNVNLDFSYNDITVTGKVNNIGDSEIETEKVKLKITYMDTKDKPLYEEFVDIYTEDKSSVLEPDTTAKFFETGPYFIFDYPNLIDVSENVEVEVWSLN
jgi:hypothetical protein